LGDGRILVLTGMAHQEEGHRHQEDGCGGEQGNEAGE
jgi:hypothetical protein